MPACYPSYGADCCCMCHASLLGPVWQYQPGSFSLGSPVCPCMLVVWFVPSDSMPFHLWQGAVFCAADGSPLPLLIVLVLEVSVSSCCVPINSPLSSPQSHIYSSEPPVTLRQAQTQQQSSYDYYNRTIPSSITVIEPGVFRPFSQSHVAPDHSTLESGGRESTKTYSS